LLEHSILGVSAALCHHWLGQPRSFYLAVVASLCAWSLETPYAEWIALSRLFRTAAVLAGYSSVSDRASLLWRD
jgi:hypothetical protein